MSDLNGAVRSNQMDDEPVEYEHLTPAVARLLLITALLVGVYAIVGIVLTLADSARLAGFTGLEYLLGFALQAAAWPIILLTS